MSNLDRVVAETVVKDKLKHLSDYIERVSDEDLLTLLVIVNDLIEKGKPIKTEKINDKGEIEEL